MEIYSGCCCFIPGYMLLLFEFPYLYRDGMNPLTLRAKVEFVESRLQPRPPLFVSLCARSAMFLSIALSSS